MKKKVLKKILSDKDLPKGEIIIYRAKDGSAKLDVKLDKKTIWLTQSQISQLFGTERSVITKHLGNIFKSGELNKKSNVQKMHIANSDKPVAFYSLDIILAVGYRTNSSKAIEFRQWATKVLRDHILKGYTINKKRITKNYDSFMKAVDSVRKLLPAASKIDTVSILELVKVFADTWFSLAAYDKGNFGRGKVTKKKVKLTANDLAAGIEQLKRELMKKGEASDLFALEQNKGSIAGIIGNIMQTFNKKDLYLSVEEKAAHLLYFMVKDHPFVDCNKRSGAFAFIWFLRCTGILDMRKLTPEALTALTLLIAESNSKDKEKMTGLVAMLLG